MSDQKYIGAVKVMRSYDYCHFEVALSTTAEQTLQEIDDMRKEAARLADKAVQQYYNAKEHAQHRANLEWEVKAIKEHCPESGWTPEQKAKVKALEDWEYYNYQDDWEAYRDY